MQIFKSFILKKLGNYPYGCNPSFSLVYCPLAGGCAYSTINDANWCCFKGCTQTSVTNATINTPITLTMPTRVTSVTVPATIVTITIAPTILTTQSTTTQVSCDSKCSGQYPYGCNPSFSLGYCSANGGCSYSEINDPNWCCFKGCSNQSIVTNAPLTSIATTTSPASRASCDSKCNGAFPYGCNPSFGTIYCHPNGGCSYAPVNDPSWCCAKGC